MEYGMVVELGHKRSCRRIGEAAWKLKNYDV